MDRLQPAARRPRLTPAPKGAPASSGSDPWTDLALTLPLLVVYHLGVVFLPMRNAADFLTQRMAALASHSLPAYAGLACGGALVLVVVCMVAGKKKAFEPSRFALVAAEGVLYAVVMRIAASYVVGRLRLAAGGDVMSPFAGVVMSFGAGFYEEVAFRVVLFGLGLEVLKLVWPTGGLVRLLVWALASAVTFSAWHYMGPEPFAWNSFVFRTVCGLAFTAIYGLRGFAPAVWTHALYDVWVLVL